MAKIPSIVVSDPNQVTLRTESPVTTTPSEQSVESLSSSIPSVVVIAAQNLGYTGNPNDTVAAQNFINANLPLVGTLTPTSVPFNPIIPTGTVAPSSGNLTGTVNSTGGVDPYPQRFTDVVLENAAALGYTGLDPVAAQQFLNDQYEAANPPTITTTNATAAADWLKANPNQTVVLNGKVVDATTVMGEAGKQAGTTTGNITGTGTAADTGTAAGTGTVVGTKPTTSIPALDTKPTTALSTSSIGALSTQSTSALDTKPVTALNTEPASVNQTNYIPSLTADQLTAALNAQQSASTKAYTDALAANQTALSKQNEEFLKNWQTSANALKTDILTGVDTKNQQFGTQATQGFMDAFKNFQIPTNQQTGVNLGNYNDNRNAAADQWWSQYVTGRR